MRDILEELTEVLAEKRDCVYCSVVETRGSTPQKAGAVMLVFPDGSQRGTLGGGCVEAEVRQRALRALHSGHTELHTFFLDDNYGWDDGLICGGRMTILADPINVSLVRPDDSNQDEAGYYHCYRRLVEEGRGCTEAVVLVNHELGVGAGTRYLFDSEGRPTASLFCPGQTPGSVNGTVVQEVSRHLVPLLQRPKPAARHGIAYLPILPRVTILIVGGGHVGQAVAHLATEVDFDIWVLDDREGYANRERFPMARRILVGDIGTTLKELAQTDITPSTYCLIVTRGHAHDEEALYHLARTPASYVGMIGSKRKKKLIYDDLSAKGIPPEALARVHSPLGFAIGSQTVPEIAISIVAELIACRNLGSATPDTRLWNTEACRVQDG